MSWYKRRRGIVEHLEAGTISLLDLAVHDYLNLKANLVIGHNCSIPAGVCITSAAAIHATCPTQISERAIQRSLEHMEKIGWIKRWTTRGKHGNYPVLVCRGTVHDLSGSEFRVNGTETTDWRQPVYVPVAEASASREIADAKLSPYREVENKEKRKQRKAKTAAKSTPPASLPDDRFFLFKNFASETFAEKHGQFPVWTSKDWKNLRVLLRETSHLDLAELQRRWNNYLGSTESYTVAQGDSLAHFCSRFDSFIAGPLLSSRKGGLDADEAIQQSIANSGLDQDGRYKRSLN